MLPFSEEAVAKELLILAADLESHLDTAQAELEGFGAQPEMQSEVGLSGLRFHWSQKEQDISKAVDALRQAVQECENTQHNRELALVQKIRSCHKELSALAEQCVS